MTVKSLKHFSSYRNTTYLARVTVRHTILAVSRLPGEYTTGRMVHSLLVSGFLWGTRVGQNTWHKYICC